jgi:ferredoxin, 2Fe-2S
MSMASTPSRSQLGLSLLHALQTAGISIGSVCGGEMSCGVCHVYLFGPADGTLNERRIGETELLEFSEHFQPSRSRLACQVRVDGSLAGYSIDVAPDD